MFGNCKFILEIIRDLEDDFVDGLVEPDTVELVALRDYGFSKPVKPLIQILSEEEKVKLCFIDDAPTPLIKVL